MAGMVHAATLLVIVLFAGKWAKWIPLSCLAGILAVVAYNMSEWRSAVTVFKGPPADALVLVTTLLLTVLVDLTVAIEVGMVLAAFLFMRSMAQLSRVKPISDSLTEEESEDPEAAVRREVPDGVEVYEVQGPLFFGAAHSFKESIGVIGKAPPGVLIIRMRHVPMIDATGIHSLKEVLKRILGGGKTRVVVCGCSPRCAGRWNGLGSSICWGRATCAVPCSGRSIGPASCWRPRRRLRWATDRRSDRAVIPFGSLASQP